MSAKRALSTFLVAVSLLLANGLVNDGDLGQPRQPIGLTSNFSSLQDFNVKPLHGIANATEKVDIAKASSNNETAVYNEKTEEEGAKESEKEATAASTETSAENTSKQGEYSIGSSTPIPSSSTKTDPSGSSIESSTTKNMTPSSTTVDVTTVSDATKSSSTETISVAAPTMTEAANGEEPQESEVAEKPKDEGMSSGIIALVMAIVFAVVVILVYVGLLLWRRYLEFRYGNRELLVNDLEFDTNDLRHFEL